MLTRNATLRRLLAAALFTPVPLVAAVLSDEPFTLDDGGYTTSSTGGADAVNVWTYSNAAGTWATEGDEDPGITSHSLTSPAITVPTGLRLMISVVHRYSFEVEWDGGVVQMSTGGGPFTTIPGAAFIQNGYTFNALIGNHPLWGAAAFNGDSDGHSAGAMVTSIAELPPVTPGTTVAVRLLGAWDEDIKGSSPNWEIDAVKVETLEDTDGDGMDDFWETRHGLNPASAADRNTDPDSDGMTNFLEFQLRADPQDTDSDDDGLPDGVETGTGTFVSTSNRGTSPVNADTDGDGLGDSAETNTGVFVSAADAGTDPFKRDTDGDAIADGAEVLLGSDPNRPGPVSVIEGGGKFTTEHVWTQGNFTVGGGNAETILDDPGMFPPENSITTDTVFIHFHDNVAPPWFVPQSTPYPLWDPVNGGAGFGDREDFAIRSRGTIKITQGGTVWFDCNSDDGFSLRIDGTEIGSAPDRARADTVRSVALTAGTHDVELVHWERGGGAGVSVLVYRAITDTDPAVSGDAWQLLEAFGSPPASGLAITSYSYNPATTVLNLTFTSEIGSNYALEYTTGFQPAGAPTSAAKWNVVPGYGSIAGAAGTTAIIPLNPSSLVTPAGQLPNNSQAYFRIRKL